MNISSRTPEGHPNRCPLCDAFVELEPSVPFGDAPCPACGQLIWFTKRRDGLMFYNAKMASILQLHIREFIADKLGISVDRIPSKIEELDVMALGGDSLAIVELVVELEEEFDIRAG